MNGGGEAEEMSLRCRRHTGESNARFRFAVENSIQFRFWVWEL